VDDIDPVNGHIFRAKLATLDFFQKYLMKNLSSMGAAEK
jgi:hypothetical protein